jgi:excisionase family DNA binding protein
MSTSTTPAPAIAPLLIGVQEVARICGLSVRKIWQMTAAGEIPRPRKCGARRLWSYAELQAWVQADCRPVGI